MNSFLQKLSFSWPSTALPQLRDVLRSVPTVPAAVLASAAALGGFLLIKRRKLLKRFASEDEINLEKYEVSLASRIMERVPYSIKWVITRLMWYPMLTWNVALSYVLPVEWWHKVDDNILLGALPFASTVPELYKSGVRGVVNCCEEYRGPVSTYAQYGIEQLYLPVVDYTSPTLEQLEAAVEFIDRFAARDESVYIHCKSGKGRSTTFVLAYWMKKKGMSRQKAQKVLIMKRPQVSRYIWRRPVLEQFERKYSTPNNNV